MSHFNTFNRTVRALQLYLADHPHTSVGVRGGMELTLVLLNGVLRRSPHHNALLELEQARLREHRQAQATAADAAEAQAEQKRLTQENEQLRRQLATAKGQVQQLQEQIERRRQHEANQRETLSTVTRLAREQAAGTPSRRRSRR